MTTAIEHRRTLLALAAALALAGIVACGGSESRSLVVVSLTASPAVSGASSAQITVGTTTRTFSLQGGLSATAQKLGVFLDGAPSGTQMVRAEVTATGACPRLAGSNTVALTGKKGEIANVDVAVTCAPGGDGGATGDGGGGDGPSATDAKPADGGGQTDGGATADGGTGDGPAPDAPATSDVAPGVDVLPPVDAPPLPSLGTCTEVKADPNCTDDGVAVFSVAFSPDGNLAVVASSDGRVRFWRVQNGKLEPDSRPTLSHPAALQARVAFSPDGSLLAVSSGEGGLALYNVASQTQVPLAGHATRVRGLAFTPDGNRLVTVDRTLVLKIWNVATRAESATSTLFEGVTEAWSLSLTARPGAIWAAIGMAQVPDSAPAGMGQGLPRDAAYVYLGNVDNPTQFTVLKADTDEVSATAISPSGRWLVAGGEASEAPIWDITNPAQPMPAGALPAVKDAATNLIGLTGLAFDAMGRSLAAVYGGFAVGGGLRTYEPGTWAVQAQRFGMTTYYPVSVALRPQGNVLLAGEVTCSVFVVCAD